jgi:hypothetical protein
MKIVIATGAGVIVLVIGELLFTGKPPDGAMFYMLCAIGFIVLGSFLLKRYSK